MPQSAPVDPSENTRLLLDLVCRELDLETAFISRMDQGQRLICYSSGPGVEVGMSDPNEATYCQLIVDGTIGPAIPDTSVVPILQELSVTHRIGIGSYLGLPLLLADGSLYGTLCAFSRAAKPDLIDADVRLLRLIASLIAHRLEEDVLAERSHLERRRAIIDALAAGEPGIVYQPIVDLGSRIVVGYEALARFSVSPYRTPDLWFREAGAMGLGLELELQAIANALESARALPEGTYLSVNASPSIVMSSELVEVLDAADRPVLVELTEHEDAVGLELTAGLDELRAHGHRIGLDDIGAGYSGLTRMLELRPDVVKVDRALIVGIDGDLVRQAMATGVQALAATMGATLVAEGVETEGEAATLVALGIPLAQGYAFGAPTASPAI